MFWIQNLVWGKYGKDVCCLVGFQKFVLQNSLPLWGSIVYFYDIATEVDIAFISIVYFYDIATEVDTAFFRYIDYTLSHEKCTKRYENW